MPREQSPGKPTTRCYSPEEKATTRFLMSKRDLLTRNCRIGIIMVSIWEASMMKINVKRLLLGGTLTVALAVAVGITPASATTQTTGPANCEIASVVIASSTVGQTWHMNSAGSVWNKGYRNGGATTYTDWRYLRWVATEAPTIWSSGFRCG